MAPGSRTDMITSKLLDDHIVLILSRLPFEEAARTSVLSHRWRHIWRRTRNVELLERYFVKPGDSDETRETKRKEFMEFVRQWIRDSTESDSEVDKFSLSLSDPNKFQDDLYAVLSFPSSRNVKELTLDFSDPSWEEDDVNVARKAVSSIPGPVYRNRCLTSLKLYSCSFMPQYFANFGSVKELSLGWIELNPASMKAVLQKCPLLESLCLSRCWNDGNAMEISGRELKLKKVKLDKCGFHWWSFDVQNLKVFKYCGKSGMFHFDGVGNPMEEVDLDFGVEKEFEAVGDFLQSLLHDLTSARVLKICSYVLQVIPSGMEQLGMKSGLETKHLTMKMQLHPSEFWGIKFMLNSCSKLESLVFDFVPGSGRILSGYVPPFEMKPDEFWLKHMITYKCLLTSLKVVAFKGFRGGWTEVLLLQYVLNFGQSLECLALYAVDGLDDDGKILIIQKAREVQDTKKASPIAHVSLHIDGIFTYI